MPFAVSSGSIIPLKVFTLLLVFHRLISSSILGFLGILNLSIALKSWVLSVLSMEIQIHE